MVSMWICEIFLNTTICTKLCLYLVDIIAATCISANSNRPQNPFVWNFVTIKMLTYHKQFKLQGCKIGFCISSHTAMQMKDMFCFLYWGIPFKEVNISISFVAALQYIMQLSPLQKTGLRVDGTWMESFKFFPAWNKTNIKQTLFFGITPF